MTVRDDLLAIYQSHGALTPEIVLEEASDPAHALHARFNWDDAEAAHKYRLSQAGQLIRSVKVKVFNPEPTEVRGFLHIDGGKGDDSPQSSYVPEEVVRSDPALQALALSQMEREWRLLRRRWSAHKEFWALIQQEVSAA